MDKYEFNIKVEQIRKLVNRGDYETAMKITDSIDWKKVRNANLLSMVAQVYEKNKEYQEAKEILLLAFERAPIGKRLLYKLTELALREGNAEEAEAYYREFCDLAGDDPRQHLLRYMILKQKDAPVEQLIHSLESYTAEELDEKWLYELAELYHLAGDADRCVSTCDKIMLMFGLGKYVDKAMELKIQYAPLTKYQMDLVENREKYEAKLRAVEQSFDGDGDGDVDFSNAGTAAGARPRPVVKTVKRAEPEVQQEVQTTGDPAVHAEGEADSGLQSSGTSVLPEQGYQPDPEIAPVQATTEQEPEGLTVEADPEPVTIREDAYEKESIVAAVKQAEVEEKLAKEMSRLADIPVQETSSELGKTRVLGAIRRAPQPAESPSEEATDEQRQEPPLQSSVQNPAAVSATSEPEVEDETLEPELPGMANHLMIEARNPEKGLELAIRVLKQIQKETGIKNPVAKITGSKLNKRGVLASAEKLAGKDLMIEEAGDLTPEMLKELETLMQRDSSGMRIVLIDNPKQMEMLHKQNPSLAGRFECIGSDDFKSSETENGETKPVPEPDDRPVRHVTPVRDGVTRVPDEADRFAEQYADEVRGAGTDAEYADDDDYDADDAADEEEMDIDEFAQYACKYAAEIDCSITGKSMLALYERIEIMEEDGVPLTRTNAEDLIEEAADRAEKPSVGKRIKGLFSSKYDKDGLLILKEEHFI